MNVQTIRWAVIAPIAAAILCSSGAGLAQDRKGGSYVSVSGLFVVPQDVEWTVQGGSADIPMKNGFGFLVAAGYSLPSGLGAELELGYRAYDYDSSSEDPSQFQFSSVSLMVNGIYSVDLNRFRPYAGVGLGLAQQRAEIEAGLRDVGEAEVFAYQVLAGIGYSVSDQAEVRLGYRYFGGAAGDFGAGVEISSANHNFEIGLAYRF